MKPLLPTLKEKKRYMVYSLVSEQPIKDDKAVLLHIKRTLGLFDGARAGVLSVKYDQQKQVGVLRVAHDCVDLVKSTFLTLTQIGTIRVRPQTIGVSGILKKTTRFEV